MINFFSICFLILPWVILPINGIADMFRLPKATFFDFICLGMIWFSFKNGLKNRYSNKYLSWFVLWVFIIIGINWYLPFTLSFDNRQSVNLWILEPMIHFFLGLWASYIAMSYFEREDYQKITKFICLSAVLVSSIGILQVLGLDIFGKLPKYNHANHFCAFLDNPNIAGNYLSLSVPFFLIQKEKKYWFWLILVLVGIIISKSHLSWVCAAAGIFIYLLLIFRKNKIFSITFLSFSLGILVFSTLNPSFLVYTRYLKYFDGRLAVWKLTWVHLKDNPIFGQGLGIFKTWEITPVATKWLTAHNDWLEIPIMIGIVGLVLLILIITNSIRKFNYKQDNFVGFAYLSSFVAFLFLMFGSFPIEVAPLALFGLLNFWAVENL